MGLARCLTVTPSAVPVKGPRSTIETRDTGPTAPVDGAGGRSRVTRTVGLAFPDSVSPVSDGQGQVRVDIQAESATTLETEGLRK